MSIDSSSSTTGLGDAEMEEINNDAMLPSEKKKSSKRNLMAHDEENEQPIDEEKQAEDEAERAKRLKVRKVSPVKKFFSSIRVIVFLVLFIFADVFCSVVGVTSLVDIRQVYEKMDTLDLKERVQNAVHGVIQGTSSVISRAAMMATDFSYYPYFTEETLADRDLTEYYLASAIFNGESVVTESLGLTEYDNLPFHLIMAWDEEWNERLAYYRPCLDPKDRALCELPPPNKTFADIANGNMTLIHKDKIPKAFRELNVTRPFCESKGVYNCTGIMNIPMEEGGPMFFTMFNVGDFSSLIHQNYPFDHWTFLVASNALLMNQIGANRTGMCMSFYASDERGLSSYMKDEFKSRMKKHKALDPTDFITNNKTYASVINIDTGEVTLDQEYYADKKKKYSKVRSNRAVCDDYYDHGDEDYISMSSGCLIYKTFDFNKGQTDEKTVAFRFEYHDPLTKTYVGYADILVSVLCVVFLLVVVCVFLYFNFSFLVPLDHLRQMRAELIRTTLSRLEDDGLIAKDLFGDMTDDTALIEGNGDEISVMLTLQARLDALYNNIINARVEEVNHARSVSRNELCALRIMNFFMRRDDQALRAVLPGLMDPDDVSRRSRRANLVVHTREGELISQIANAKRSFRSLKAVLSNSIATQFFKAFCIQRGRSSVNSFFFLMDVSWLHQVEAGDRKEQDDFLSAMFSDSVSPSPSLSPRSPFLNFSRSTDDGAASDVLCSPDTSAFDLHLGEEPNRPHHSHFKNRRGSDAPEVPGDSSPRDSPKANPAPVVEEEETKKGPRMPKLPVAKTSSTSGHPTARSGAMTPGRVGNLPEFSSKISDGIAHFIYESYFGRRSLAQRDLRHAALLGCSQVPDYLKLRDSENVSFSPIMFDNLVTAVTKKFTADVLPQFLNSISFQVMFYALMVTGFFDNLEHQDEQAKEEKKPAEQVPLFDGNDLLKCMWQACVNPNRGKGEKKKDDDSSSSSSDSDTDDTETDDESDDSDDGESADKDKKPSQKTSDAEKKPEPKDDKKPSKKDDDESSSSDDESSSSSESDEK